MGKVLFLTSSMDLYDTDDAGEKIAKRFENTNGILDNLKRCITTYGRILIVASAEDSYALTDRYGRATCRSFAMTLPFERYDILDGRNLEDAEKLVRAADVVFLSGGHVPTENAFFRKIGLGALLRSSHAVVIGQSAGSMNAAAEVYAPPELPGEAADPMYCSVLRGLSLTDFHILPHFSEYREVVLDGKRCLEDILLPDSFRRTVYALNDGSYILEEDGRAQVFGECWRIRDGRAVQICAAGERRSLCE